MKLEHTQDVDLIKSIIGHPMVRGSLFQEGEEPKVPLYPTIYYLVAREERIADGSVEDKVVGVAAFHPVNSITWTPHIAVLPEHRGRGSELMNLAAEWMFENTACRKLFAAPPAFNEAMVRCFEKCGFSREGVSPASFMWHGTVYDRILMGKEAVCGLD